MNPSTIDEYKTCDKYFLIPEENYEKFRAFCTKKDKGDNTKLIIKPENPKIKKYKGRNIRKIEITATSYVGIFNIPDVHNSTLIVSPKIGPDAFLQMLHYIDEQKIIIQKFFAQGLKKSDDFVNVFLHFLIKTIYDLLITSIRKEYDLVNEDISFVKGKVDYLKTIRNRFNSSNQLACQYFRFNSNTLINKAIKYTLIHIKDVIPQKSMILYREIMTLLNSVDVSNFRLSDFNRITYNRLNINYKEILSFCSLILRNQMVSLEKGKLSFPAFCFNSWNIFEVFIRKILKIYCSKNYIVKKKRYYTSNESVDPDIILKNRKTREKDLVIDVKYKDYYEKSDYNEIHTFKTSIKAKKGMLLYPQRVNKQNTVDFFYEFFDFKEWLDRKEDYLEDFTVKILSYIKD